MSLLEDTELTPLKYARLYNLALNHQTHPLPTSQISMLRDEVPNTLTDDGHLKKIEVPVYVSTVEHLAIDKQGALLLAEANGGRSINLESTLDDLLESRLAKSLHIEQPLLKTDHDADIRAFASWEQPQLDDGNMPHETLNIELDEGMEWPTRFKCLSTELLNEINVEKIEMSKAMLVYLIPIFTHTWTTEDEDLAWESACSYTRNTALEPVTPPLMPSSPVVGPYIPSSPACHLPLLSNPPSLLSDDLRAAEQPIFEQDSLEFSRQNNSGPGLMSLVGTINKPSCEQIAEMASSKFIKSEEPPQSSPGVKRKDHKVEVPITPARPTLIRTKSVTFNEIVEEMLLDRQSDDGRSDSSLGRLMGEASEKANREMEQEQLQEADSKSRVEVPKMDFTLPDPPWKHLQNIRHNAEKVLAVQMADLLSIKAEYGLPVPWPGADRLNMKLPWAPFKPELGRIAFDEGFGGEHDLDPYLFDMSSVADSSDLTWKPPGLRILKIDENDDEGEDEIDMGYFMESQPQDIDTLVRKRKMQYEYEKFCSIDDLSAEPMENPTLSNGIGLELDESRMITIDKTYSLHPGTTSSKPSRDDSSRDAVPEITGCLLGGAPFCAANALENFKEIRGAKKQKTTATSSLLGKEKLNSSLHPHSASTVRIPQHSDQPIAPVKHKGNIVNTETLPAPLLKIPDGLLQCIISSTLLRHRIFMRTLQNLLPTLDTIERDFSAHNSTAWLPGSVSRSPIRSTLADEADLITSPSTGIILTSLQQIRQKPLPGQKAKAAIRARVEAVCVRYEKLIVLVSEGNTDAVETSHGLDEHGVAAFAELTGFCANMEIQVVVNFVAGGQATLGKWVAALVCQTVVPQEMMIAPLLVEESLWELFLRRAGMNAFAAHAVLADLKAASLGLSAFVEMGVGDRERRFGLLLGGTKVLERVAKVLDVNWSIPF